MLEVPASCTGGQGTSSYSEGRGGGLVPSAMPSPNMYMHMYMSWAHALAHVHGRVRRRRFRVGYRVGVAYSSRVWFLLDTRACGDVGLRECAAPAYDHHHACLTCPSLSQNRHMPMSGIKRRVPPYQSYRMMPLKPAAREQPSPSPLRTAHLSSTPGRQPDVSTTSAPCLVAIADHVAIIWQGGLVFSRGAEPLCDHQQL